MRLISGLLFSCALGTLSFLLHTEAQAAPYGVNLLVNGNAEGGPSSSTGAPVSVPSWTTSSAFTVIPYGAPGGYPTSSDPGPPDRASQFFGGGNAAVSTATQEIDLSANGVDINQGNVIYSLSGSFGGFQSDNDNARLSATFFNGATSLDVVTIGHVTAKDRSNATGLLPRCGSGAMPVNTTRVVLTQTMTRFSGASNDGYADSLSFVCSLKTGSQTTAETFAGNGTRASATGPWSDPAHWSPPQVPNSCGSSFFDATLTGLELSSKLSNEDRIITRTFGTVRLDISATVSNLTLNNAGLSDGGFTGLDSENLLTVTGTTTDLSFQNQAESPGFSVTARLADAAVSLGNFANFAGDTLSSTKLTLFSQGPAATVQFTGADIVTLANASVSITGPNTHVIDENGNDALRHLAVIGTGGSFAAAALDFVTGGDLTVDGFLQLNDSGLDTSLTVTGVLKNFDAASRTLSGGSISLRHDGAGVATNVILRFNDADIVNNGASLSLTTPATKIVDQNDSDALRNFAHNLASGSVNLTDHNLTSTGAFTNDGILFLSAQSLPTSFTVNGPLTNLDGASRTLNGGVFRVFGSFSNASATATLRFNGADIVHNAASIVLGSSGAILDQASNDGLRNFVDNTESGFFELIGQSFTAPSEFTNAGVLSLANFDPSQVFSVAGGHSYVQTGGETSLGDSVMTAANVVIQGGIIHRGGTINGNVSVEVGTIAPTSSGGGGVANLDGFIVVVPGNTSIPGPDNMTINGNLVLSPGAHLSLVIRGTPQGEFDTMNVSGSAGFGGTLEVALINDFTPQPTDSFTVLTAGPPITGAFANVANGSRILTSEGRGSFIATYGDNHLVLSNFESLPPSDLDAFVFYSTKGTKGTPKLQPFGPVALTDGRGSVGYDVKAVVGLGLPAEKNGGSVFDSVTHLARYAVKGHKPAPKFQKIPDVVITTECGNLVITVQKPDSLLVPVNEDPTTAPAPPDPQTSEVDHFLCYKAKAQKKRTDGTPVAVLPKKLQVEAVDHFQTRRYDVKKITRLCVPVATSGVPVVLKTGTSVPFTDATVRHSASQLVCYAIKRAKKTIAQTTCGPVDPKAKGTKIIPPQPKHQKRIGLLVDGAIGSASLDTKTELELCVPVTGMLPLN